MHREPATLAWNKLHFHAFSDLNADIFVYVDPSIPKWKELRDTGEIKLGSLVRDAIGTDLIIGDYRPVGLNASSTDPAFQNVDFKIQIEKNISELLLGEFPSLARLNISRPRSEFHGLSRKLYDALREREPIPYDYGLQMLIVAQQQGLAIKSVDIGEVPEFGKYDQRKMDQQILRVRFQLQRIKELR